MPERIASVTGTTSAPNEDITAAIKTGLGIATADGLLIRKLQINTDVSDELFINDNTKSVLTLEEIASSGVFVLKTNYGEVNYYKIVVKTSGTTWTVTALY